MYLFKPLLGFIYSIRSRSFWEKLFFHAPEKKKILEVRVFHQAATTYSFTILYIIKRWSFILFMVYCKEKCPIFTYLFILFTLGIDS